MTGPHHKLRLAPIVLPLLAALCLLPFVPSALALFMGIVTALTMGNPYLSRTRVITPRLLSFSVMGLGAGMDLRIVARVGMQGIGYTLLGISCTLVLGLLLRRALKIDRNTSVLITVGTAICGGSAIAAAAPTIDAKPQEISVALGTVFLLNALALLVFPLIGHALDLTQVQFGLWSALSIHDTSSVVGATLQYGAEALRVGTTVKLARALWIVPVTVGVSFFLRRKKSPGQAKAKRPWFILGFLLMAALVTAVPPLQPVGHVIESLAKRGLVLTLFLIGTNLTWDTLRAVGLRPLVQGVILWITTAGLTLVSILLGWVH